MNISIALDLPGIIANACATERLQPLIDKAIGEALKSAIDDATGYRSEFRSAMVVQLKQALPHGLRADDVAKFQQVLNRAVNAHVHGANAATVATALEKVTRDVLPDVPAVVKLSDLMVLARDGFHKEAHEAFYAFWEPCSYGGGWLYLHDDQHPVQSYGGRPSEREGMKYHADYRLGVNKEGMVYAMHFDGKDITPSSNPGVCGEFQATLLAMYVGRTRLEVDIDDDDVRRAAAEPDE